MATHLSPSGPPTHQAQHFGAALHAPPNGAMAMQPTHPPPQPAPAAQAPAPPKTAAEHLANLNEQTWLQLGHLCEVMSDPDGAISAYEHAITINRRCVQGLLSISCILRAKDQYTGAVEYLKQIIQVQPTEGEVWSSLGHCYLMMDDLQQAYTAYQQALYHLQNPREPKLWYGIGILYDRYGSLEHAEEAFSQVMYMDPSFEKANEIYFRLGIIYKQQQKFDLSLGCFKYIVRDPPRPLNEEDIWFQIGHVHEQQKEYELAKQAYMRVLDQNPQHAKVLQQLGWLHHQQSNDPESQEQAITYLEKSVNADNSDAQSWYLLGRCYMSQQKYPKAYEAYQQAVYRDGRNPTFWCSIGVLYYQINQYRDALDAYSRAIRLNPNISEVWYDLGTLYESCNNQTSDAMDAYQRAADLDPTNVHIKARLALLKGQAANGLPSTGAAPHPTDIHPQAYQPGALGGPPGPNWNGHSQNAAPPGPAPPPLVPQNGWAANRMAEPQNIQVQPRPANPYDSRDRMQQPAGPPPPHPAQSLQRQPSPPRQYREPQRPPPPAHRGLSPSPKGQQSTLAGYGAPHHQIHAHPQHQPPPPPQNKPYGASLPPQIPSYAQARQPSPRSDVRPLAGPTAAPPNQYPRMSSYDQSPSATGPPPPFTQPAEPLKDERAGNAAPKRVREWEEEHNPAKKQFTEESRSRPEEIKVQRQSPPSQEMVTPPTARSTAEVHRAEDVPRPSSAYHPSEAAHHPPPAQPSLAPPSANPSPPRSAPPQDDARAPPPAASMSTAPSPTLAPAPSYEPAARKIDVDEDYDDSGEDEKREVTKLEPERNSPTDVNGAAATPVPVAVEQKA